LSDFSHHISETDAPKLANRCFTMSPGNPFILRSKDHKVCIGFRTECNTAAARGVGFALLWVQAFCGCCQCLSCCVLSLSTVCSRQV